MVSFSLKTAADGWVSHRYFDFLDRLAAKRLSAVNFLFSFDLGDAVF